MTELAVNSGLLARSELESGKPAPESPKLNPPLTAEKVAGLINSGIPASRNVPADPRFRVGQHVRARNLNPVGHTRLPRYVRGKRATIERDHGVFVFPDSNAHFLGEKPQHVYSVRFTARELWGDQANAHDAVYVNLWDDHLEPA
jgi:nitrile hydratase subunit beta